jgi:hypothetical protein
MDLYLEFEVNSSSMAPPYAGVDTIMETLRNLGIEFVVTTLKELQLATPNVFFPYIYTL